MGKQNYIEFSVPFLFEADDEHIMIPQRHRLRCGYIEYHTPVDGWARCYNQEKMKEIFKDVPEYKRAVRRRKLRKYNGK